MLFARIVYCHDVRVGEASRRLRLPEEALLHVGELLRLEFLGDRQRLDGDLAADLRVLAEVDHAHRTLAKFPVDHETAELRLLHRAVEYERAPGMARATADHDRFGELAAARDLGIDVAEVRLEAVQVAEHGLGLVELPFAL